MNKLIKKVREITDEFADEYYGLHHQDEYHKKLQEIIDIVDKSQLEKVVLWAIKQGFATGHADNIESLLSSIELDIKELREKACLSDLQVQMNTDNG